MTAGRAQHEIAAVTVRDIVREVRSARGNRCAEPSDLTNEALQEAS